MNVFNNKSETIADPVKKGQSVDDLIQKSGEFDFFLKRENLGAVLPKMMGVALLIVGYIFLSHYHVKSLKEEEKLKKDLNELRAEYITIKSDLMQKSKQSEVASSLKEYEIKELRTPPYILKEENKK